MHNKKHTQNPPIPRHLVILLSVLVLVIAASVYFFTRRVTVSGFSGLSILILLIVLAALGATLHLTRGLVLGRLQSFHGPQAGERLETEGKTIPWASSYDLLVKSLLFGKEQSLREAIVRLAQIRPGDKVLDVGCGTGTLAITAQQMSGAGAQIYGIDAAPEMIEVARAKAAKAGAEVHFQTGLAEALDFPDQTFDVVMNSFMVHHLPGDLKTKAFAEIYRVLKPGGRLLIVDFEPPKTRLASILPSLLLGHGMMQIDNSPIPGMLKAAGFGEVQTGSAGNPLAAYMRCEKG